MPGTECRCPVSAGGWRLRGMDRHREAVLGVEWKPTRAHFIPLILLASFSIPQLITIPVETLVELAGQRHTPTAGPYTCQALQVAEVPSPRPGGSVAGVRNASPGARNGYITMRTRLSPGCH